MKLEMTELGPVKRALKIEVPEDAVNDEFQKVYGELKRQVRIPGFRQGKAPIAVLEKRYAKMVEQDVVQRIVPNYYQQAVKEAGVVPVVVDIPPFERLKIQRNSPFTFTATVDIKPTIKLGDYRPPNPISLKPDTRTVTEEQIEQALANLQEQHAQIDAAPEGAVLADGMHAVLTLEGLLDGEPVDGTKKTGHLHKMGSKTPILGVEAEEHLLGQPAGSRVDIKQEYPANHPDERLAGKTVTFSFTIDAIKQQTLPELDDEFAKDCGDYENLEQLRSTIHDQFDTLLKRDIEDGYKEQIIDRLVTMHHFDIPEPLIERELQTMVRQKLLRDHQKGQGGADDPLKLQEEAKQLQQELQPEAKKRVKLGLILESITEKEGLTVEDEDIEAEMVKLAQQVKLPVEEVRKMVEAGGQQSRDEFRERLLAEKALQLVYQFSVIQG
ncbi:MAG: trigger factor [Nitrospirales bacterium]|nr:MAG: trigger factor [Nitrospirales bacterium]